ncbi:hypothetical protein [Streptomyces sp. CMB-StM0423]|uniref:hypothetical protein n=1 Tax=Streptomyces sp. CMB-StM0423 TaxID=2059884 RepID=UPI000C701187|nr:hypothetical protein [Streptomyces sp. CMB-StM0423]AUH40539.1 hypothetical protein CXR04_10025 [Streptomyces sp. CMB-StM0423]
MIRSPYRWPRSFLPSQGTTPPERPLTSSVDLTEEIHHLRRLAAGFKALDDSVLGLTVIPGADALRRLVPLLLTSQELVSKTLLRLSALESSPYAEAAGSLQGLNALRALVLEASLASCNLAHAVAANPLHGVPFGRLDQDDNGSREARHADAVPAIEGHLADSALQLDVCADGCLYLAGSIARTLDHTASKHTTTSARQAVHKLSQTQHKALQALARGGATMQTKGRGSTFVLTPDRTRITIATFQALDKRGLVHLDTSVPLYQGRPITVTANGRRALAQHRVHAEATAPPAAAPSPRAPAAAPRR